MKRLSIIVACLLISSISACAVENGGIEGSNPGVMNKQNIIQLQDLQIEKKYIEFAEKMAFFYQEKRNRNFHGVKFVLIE